MSNSRRVIVCALGTVAMAAALSWGGPSPAMDVEPGLWEVNSHPQASGPPPVPADVLQQMPPERRAAFEAAMARRSQPHTFKMCMTEADRSRGFAEHDDRNSSCKTTVVTNTSSEYEFHKECSSEDNQRTESAHFRISGRHQVSGTVDVVLTRAGHTTTVHNTIEAKWLGADCGSVKKRQVEK